MGRRAGSRPASATEASRSLTRLTEPLPVGRARVVVGVAVEAWDLKVGSKEPGQHPPPVWWRPGGRRQIGGNRSRDAAARRVASLVAGVTGCGRAGRTRPGAAGQGAGAMTWSTAISSTRVSAAWPSDGERDPPPSSSTNASGRREASGLAPPGACFRRKALVSRTGVDSPLGVVGHQIGDGSGSRPASELDAKSESARPFALGAVQVIFGRPSAMRCRARRPASSGHASCREHVAGESAGVVLLRGRCECSADAGRDERLRSFPQ